MLAFFPYIRVQIQFMAEVKEKKKNVSLNSVIAAAKRLSAEDKQLLRMKLFGDDALLQLKLFEKEMRKKRKSVKKSDDEIVNIVKKIRSKR